MDGNPPAVIPEQVSELVTSRWSLKEAQGWLREQVDDGARCPCCTQLAKVYRRRIHHTIAKSLIAVYQLATPQNEGWVHVPSQISPACEIGKARYWGLIEESTTPRGDGGRAGWWRLTAKGVAFVEGREGVRRIARIYDSRCLGFDGEFIYIAQALGSKFNYAELMAGQKEIES
jgi:hypothetical protein